MEPIAPREAIFPAEYALPTMRLFHRVQHSLLAKDEVVGDIMIKPTRHRAKSRIVFQAADHDTDREGFKVQVEIPILAVRDGRVQGLTDAWCRYAEIRAREMRAMLYRNLSSMTSASGMSVNHSGSPANPELLLAAFEKVEVAFDEDGKPMPKKLLVPPGLHEAIMSQWTQ